MTARAPRPTDAGRWMRRALELARRGEGLTRPNPPVGAVVVRAGRAVGEGWHRRAGTPHAEVHALRAAGAAAHGADLYVTLEPCCTHGRTPPCTDRIIEAGIRRVLVSAIDPNPRHAGRGLRRLRRAGIVARAGIRREEGEALIAPFRSWVLAGRPRVTLKLAVSLDGRLADRDGRSRWISSPASRAAVADGRRRADAILVGVDTVIADDPSLQPRPARGRAPMRVIVDSRGRTPLRAKVLRTAREARTLIATTARCPAARRRAYLRAGADVAVLRERKGRVDLRELLAALGRLDVMSVWCEGGGRLAASLLEQGLADETLVFVAPLVLGPRGVPAFGGASPALADAPRLRVRGTGRSGADVWIGLEPAKRPRRGGG